jgi:hypothetical protein
MPRPRGRFRPVLTPAGFAAAAIALFLLIRSLTLRNAYEIVLAAALLCVLLVLFLTGAWGAGRLAALSPGWNFPSPLGAGAPEEVLITGLDLPMPLFFRLHLILRGRFFPGGSPVGCPMAAETSVPRKGDAARLRFGFPMSGLFRGEDNCRLRDIFGFFSFPCGIPGRRALAIRSAPCAGEILRIEAHAGAEDRRNKSSNDVERYYMREYAPGDRLRDINWKSSERIDTLITRISPEEQEKVNRIEVHFRNYGPLGGSSRLSLESLWLLDRAKAQLARFLRSAKENQSKYVFHVRAAEGAWDLRTQDEIEAFLDTLAGLPFSPARQEGPVAMENPGLSSAPPSGENRGDLYVFSTACDWGLSAFLMSAARPVFLFLCRPALPRISPEKVERLYLRDFPAAGIAPPLHWLHPRQDRPGGTLNPPLVSGGRAVFGYAEARW